MNYYFFDHIFDKMSENSSFNSFVYLPPFQNIDQPRHCVGVVYFENATYAVRMLTRIVAFQAYAGTSQAQVINRSHCYVIMTAQLFA